MPLFPVVLLIRGAGHPTVVEHVIEERRPCGARRELGDEASDVGDLGANEDAALRQEDALCEEESELANPDARAAPWHKVCLH